MPDLKPCPCLELIGLRDIHDELRKHHAEMHDTEDALRAENERLKARVMELEFIPVLERLPDKDDSYLVVYQHVTTLNEIDENIRGIDVAYFYVDSRHWAMGFGHAWDVVIGWMELPEVGIIDSANAKYALGGYVNT